MAFRLRPSILRLSIFIINPILEVINLRLFILKLFGVFILGLSIFVSINKSNTPEILGNYLFNGGVYSAFFCSIFLIILPAWGSIALKRYSRLMLILYAAGVAILAIITFCAGISLIVFPAPVCGPIH
ncbi:unnamed protein product [Taenia asiatica]|uniref:Aa_trans domain-containing protein n=1 Tax=Taenia asiatica TaxID=60517 RepID=A0A0R3W8I0_TAEAS|nr:unnamed protein product [Taenia asiatica]